MLFLAREMRWQILSLLSKNSPFDAGIYKKKIPPWWSQNKNHVETSLLLKEEEVGEREGRAPTWHPGPVGSLDNLEFLACLTV